jgi:hypothetical protein
LKSFSFALFLVFCGSLLTGCCSTRFTTTIHKTEISDLKGKAVFKIVKASPPPHHYMSVTPTGYVLDNKYDIINLGFARINIAEEAFRKRLFQVALKRYPELFRDSPDAIPIDVCVMGENSSSIGPSITAEILTLTILGGIFPLPFSGTSDFNVRTELHEMVIPGTRNPVRFVRKDVVWITCLTPLGLIPIPGESECERTCEVGQTQSFQQGGDLTLQGFVDAIVVSLNGMDFSHPPSGIIKTEDGRFVPSAMRESVADESVPERLKKLKELKDKGVISEAEYNLGASGFVRGFCTGSGVI